MLRNLPFFAAKDANRSVKASKQLGGMASWRFAAQGG
jgi:hypothetical protein